MGLVSVQWQGWFTSTFHVGVCVKSKKNLMSMSGPGALGVLAVALSAAWPALVQARTAGTVVADVVALDQSIVYNRYGSFNPYGMIYALKRDVIDLDTGKTLDQPGVEAKACRVALRSDKRPRPLVIRGNIGDKLEVKFTNLLCDSAPGTPGNDPFAEVEPLVPEIPEPGAPPEPAVEVPNGFSRPATRHASMMFNGLTHDTSAPGYNTWDPRVTGISGIAPGESITYRLLLEREGGHLFHDNAAPAGGEGDGGSTVLGLFGTVTVEPAGANVYRSEVNQALMAAVRVNGVIDYDAVDTTGSLTGEVGTPLLNMHQSLGGNRWAVVHTDLNAVVQDHAVVADNNPASNENWFREFTTIFHDELKTVQAYGEVFDHTGAGAGLRDGFGINYGSSGLGAMVASNRLGKGPAANCAECALEDFFLTSWANGDPAMVVKYDADNRPQQLYADDPGNVHHSYIGDPVKFRAMQAGVKETHVFHLHANQWFAKSGPSNDKSTYLDSQTLSPRQALTYEIAYNGSNRNLSVGDAIYHCHMYPHFGQGMWALWRGHDVFEDGSRRLPDGELGKGTDPITGATEGGAFSPAVVPIRGMAMAPTPTYGANATPGFPFFVPGQAGHRPPQPPLDLTAESQLGTTGLGRHVITQGTRVLGAGVAAADMSSVLQTAELKLLPHAGTTLERAAMNFHATAAGHNTTRPDGTPGVFKVNGQPAKPGAPYADPCPATAPVREYNVSAIQLDLVVNKAGWHDPQARINVLSSEVADYEGRSRPADPFFFRAHSGDCVVFKHTNRLPAELVADDFQARTPTDTIGQHIHLVKFDVTSSDGGGNGWNYEDGTFARDALKERVEAAHHFGTVTVVRPNGTEVVHDASAVLPQAADLAYQTTVQRWWADPVFDSTGADQTLRTVFTHDHFGASSIQQHGFYNALVVEPKGSKWLTPDGQPLTTGVGPQAIIRGADDRKTHPNFREFMLASADFSLLYTSSGKPVDPPPRPEAISAGHHNPYLVNYKNEPLPLRLSADGDPSTLYTDNRGDQAFAFSSSVHGDPFTPVLKAYEGERVQLRLIHGAQEVQQVFTLHGHRWRREVSDKTSTWVGAQEIGISEHFEINTGKLAKVSSAEAQRDYLYHYGTTDALWNGAWGILRAYDKPGSVDPVSQQLLSNVLQPLDETVTAETSGLNKLIQSLLAANSCPFNSKQRTYNVQVWAARDLLPGKTLVYNKRAGITDPTALMYVHAGDVAGLRAGVKAPEPLVMRANAGECIIVNLTNKLPANLPVPDLPGDAEMPRAVTLNADHLKPSKYVGMHAGVLSFDPRTSDGANVGYNPEQLAAPGQTKSYTWYAGRIKAEDAVLGMLDIGQPIEFGTVPLRAMSDVVKQGAQGLIGSLIVEPQNSTWWNAANTSMIGAATSTTATIRTGTTKFKEFVLHYQDGLNLRKDGASANEIRQHWVGDDSYDLGERALNYRTEPLWSRIDYTAQLSGGNCTEALVISGDINPCVLQPTLMVDNDSRLPADLRGLPVETPVFEAKAGDAVRFRVLQADGRARQHSFRVIGHNYADLGMEHFLATGASLIAPGKAVTADLYGGAKKGYWHYRDGPTPFVNTGLWGLFKVQ